MENYTHYLSCFLLFLCAHALSAQELRPPNILLIVTDDQGYGDFGFTGNPHIKTPHLDQLAAESVHLENFYVSPVCAPTRSSLLTGRYSLRTGVHDTYNGGAIMASEEITLAEVLKEAGYRTGIFGKWHLGDNYPSRPIDQGFAKSLIHLSGGMGQVGDFTTYFQGDSSYYDPVLWFNGSPKKYEGYCSDIFASEAMEFINENKDSPFFCYLSFNAPHTPLQVPEEYLQLYQDMDPSFGFASEYPELDKMTPKDIEDARRVYAMVTNIDDNIGKILQALEQWKLTNNTLVIFMTDNGPQQIRYKSGLRGRKGSVFQGGVKVPCLMRYPAGFTDQKNVGVTAAHIDIFPTITDICGITELEERLLDGRSLLPWIQGNSNETMNRSLFFYWNRRYPEKYSNMALQKGSYRLVGQTSYHSSTDQFQLYDISRDASEKNNLVSIYPEVAESLRRDMDSIYGELIQSPHLKNPPAIGVGTPYENPVVLNRNDASGERGIWNQESVYGFWNVDIAEGIYDIRFRFITPVQDKGKIVLEAGSHLFQQSVEPDGKLYITMKNVNLPALKGTLTATLFQQQKNILPFWIELNRVDL